MASLNVDERTAERISERAQEAGLSVAEYLRRLVSGELPAAPPMSQEELDRGLAELAFRGPSLPSDFSRADIYREHD